MKNKLLLPLAALALLASCSSTNDGLSFSNSEYTLKNGDSIKVNGNGKNVTYSLIGNHDSSITLSSSGTISFPNTIPNYSQVLAIAKRGEMTSKEIVLTLYYDYLKSDITFTNKIDYIMDGERVSASDSNGYGIVYSLKNDVPGISIDSSSGRLSYTSVVTDGTKFVVVASSGIGSSAEHTFTAVTENIVKANGYVAINHVNPEEGNSFVLDYSGYPSIEGDQLVSLTNAMNKDIDSTNYSYDTDTKTLTLTKEYISSLKAGEHTIKAITERNAITFTLKIATKYIYTAEELASLPDLSGYYIQMADIDLADYLADKPLGWTPIGLYHDLTDSTAATADAFKGTYDGNGHVVTNLYATRKDEASFNFGLFGYVTSSSIIRNIGVKGRANVSSYSGGLVGSNSGLIENCYSEVVMDVYSGGDSYKHVGGFVGNNFGTIRSSYSNASVRSDIYKGSFVGSNEGTIEDCFARAYPGITNFAGVGKVASSCILFSDSSAMQAYDYSDAFTSSYWSLEEGRLPLLVPDQY